MTVALTLTEAQLDTLRHMLGINEPGMAKPVSTRDYYCANPGDAHVAGLVAAGAVVLYDTRGSYEWFRCTPAGRAAAMASHRLIRHSKAKRVYGRFLDAKEAFQDLTFKTFLTDPYFARARREA